MLFFINYPGLALPVCWCICPNGAILVLGTRPLLESSSPQANVLQFWWELCHPCFSGQHFRSVLFTQKYTQEWIQTAEQEDFKKEQHFSCWEVSIEFNSLYSANYADKTRGGKRRTHVSCQLLFHPPCSALKVQSHRALNRPFGRHGSNHVLILSLAAGGLSPVTWG